MSQVQAQRSVEPAHVAIIFALSAESCGTVDLLTHAVKTRGDGFVARQGVLSGRRVVVFDGGTGRQAAARATQAAIGGHRPRWVISAGFAGALQPHVARGDIVIADEVLDISGRRLPVELGGKFTSDRNTHVGRFFTVDKIIATPAEKHALGLQHAALAVDMESWAVGEVCRQDKVGFLTIRVISDAIDDELPRDLDHLVQQKSTAARLGAAAGMLFRRPSSVKDMWRLKEQSLIAADRLAKFLADVVAKL